MKVKDSDNNNTNNNCSSYSMAIRANMLRMILLSPIFGGILPGVLSEEEFGLRTISL